MGSKYLSLHPQGHMHTRLVNPEVILEDASWPLILKCCLLLLAIIYAQLSLLSEML